MIKKVALKKIAAKKASSFSFKEYNKIFVELKKRVKEAQIQTSIIVNKNLIALYWQMGKTITEQQEIAGWGTGFINQLAGDLSKDFPGVAGFSRTNISRMRLFYKAYENGSKAIGKIESAIFATIPWGHNVILLEKLKNNDERLWYAQKVIEHGWSRSTLAMHIDSKFYKRQGKALTNFSRTLPESDSDYAQQTLKDPYILDFLLLQDAHVERDIEQGLLNHIQKFLLELGQGFAFVGRQVHLEVDRKEYYVDLLFYHLELRCYLAIELKAREFDPRDIGQIGFYLAAIDDTLKHPDDKQTIGLLLCQSKSKITVEYALRMTTSPVAVASYEAKIVYTIQKEFKGKLPTTQEIEDEFVKSIKVVRKKSQKKSVKVSVKKGTRKTAKKVVKKPTKKAVAQYLATRLKTKK